MLRIFVDLKCPLCRAVQPVIVKARFLFKKMIENTKTSDTYF
jgi:hypothetical protein